MYIVAGLFGWVLRAWKIGEMEMLEAEKGTTIDQIDHVQTVATTLDRVTSKELRAKRSSFVHRLFTWRRV